MSNMPCKNQHCKSFGRPHPNCQCYGGYAYGGKIQHFCDRKSPHQEGCKYSKGGEVSGFSMQDDSHTHYTLKHPKGDILRIAKHGLSSEMHSHIQKLAHGGKAKEEIIEEPIPTPTPEPVPSSQVVANAPDASVPEAPMPQPTETPVPVPTQNREPASVTADLPATTAPLPQNALDLSQYKKPQPQQAPQQFAAPSPISAQKEVGQMEKTLSDSQKQKQEAYSGALDAMKKFNEGKIDFDRVWHNAGTGSKILAGIGILLGGAGSRATGGHNMAMQSINDTIQRDIEQQKADLGKHVTALDKYMKIYGDIDIAAEHEMKDLQAITAAKMTQFDLKNKQAMMQGLSTGGGGQTGQFLNYLRMFNPDAAKSLEGRYLPNLGITTTLPVPEKDRNELAARTDFDKTLNQLETFARQHAGSLDPATIQQGKTLAKSAQDQLRRVNAEGTFKEGEQHYNESVIPGDPTKFWAEARTLPAYQIMRQHNKIRFKTKLSQFMEQPSEGSEMFSSLTPRKVYAASPSKSK